MGLLDIFKTKNAIASEVVKEEKSSPNSYIAEQQRFRQFQDLRDLEDAISEAENITNPQRTELNRIFDEIEQDPHLSSQWENRKMKTIQREWCFVGADGEKDEKITELFDSDWFHKMMHLILDSKKRGFELITFGKWNGDKFLWSKSDSGKILEPIRHINYDHVIPEKGLLIKNIGDQDGVDLFKAPYSNKTLFVGSPSDFGFLLKCAKYILIKNNCLGNWSEFAEVFGHDLRIGKTSSTGDARKLFFDMLKKLGSGGFGVMDEDDDVIFAGTSRSDAYQVYKELNEYVDKNISKLIHGQDVISDMTGVTRGTAAENVADTYSEHDAKFLKGVINDEVTPKMIEAGVQGLEGVSFQWVNTEDVDITDKADIDLKITKMGKVLSDEYITETYGVELSEVEPERVSNPEQVAKALKNLYGGGSK